MRLADALAAPRASVGASAPAAWRVDEQALERACSRLGLKRPVRVHVTRGRGGRRKDGLHRVERGVHVLSVVAGTSAVEASRVLWHELEHAAQEEAFGEGFYADYREESRAHGYERNRFEVAARRAERRHDVWFALVIA